MSERRLIFFPQFFNSFSTPLSLLHTTAFAKLSGNDVDLDDNQRDPSFDFQIMKKGTRESTRPHIGLVFTKL